MNISPAPSPACPTAIHPADQLACRLDIILGALLLVVAARFRVLGHLAGPVWTRISHARQRLIILLGHLAAGRLPRRHISRPGRSGGPCAVQLPRRHGWLVHVVGYEAAGHGSQLAALLSDPAAQALLAAAPGAARAIRRLCRLLGVDLPPLLQPPPPPAPPAEPATRAASAPASAPVLAPARHAHRHSPLRRNRVIFDPA